MDMPFSNALADVLKLVALFHGKGLLAYPLSALLKDALLCGSAGEATAVSGLCARYDLDTLSEPRNLDTLLALFDRIEAFALARAEDRLGRFFNEASLLDAHQCASQRPLDSSEPGSLIYGEIEFRPFTEILGIASTGLQGRAKFVDLGSGLAKAVLWVSLVSRFEQIVGIEINSRMHSRACEILGDFRSTLYDPLFPTTPRQLRHAANIELLLGSATDLAAHDWTDADLVFANSAAFAPSLMAAITALSLRMRPGARFVSLAHSLEHPLWKVVYRDRQIMSWGPTTVWIHEKISSTHT